MKDCLREDYCTDHLQQRFFICCCISLTNLYLSSCPSSLIPQESIYVLSTLLWKELESAKLSEKQLAFSCNLSTTDCLFGISRKIHSCYFMMESTNSKPKLTKETKQQKPKSKEQPQKPTACMSVLLSLQLQLPPN